MEKMNIKVTPELCAECLNCQLRCSLQYEGVFNPSKARIVVGSGGISFTDDCVPGCLLCTRYCAYGAIAPAKREG